MISNNRITRTIIFQIKMILKNPIILCNKNKIEIKEMIKL